MAYLEAAFDAVIKDHVPSEKWYVVLMEDSSYYGGPEEGGWWGHDTDVLKYAVFNNEEAALQAKERVKELAAELEVQARTEYGEGCLRQLEWLDARGLDADFFPEDDGPSRYWVYCGQEIPQPSVGPRHYE